MGKPYNNIDIVITGNVAWCDALTWDEKICYGVIRGLTRNDFYCCYASNQHLAEQLNKTERTVRSFLKRLEEQCFIVRDYGYIECENGKIRRLRVIVPKELWNKFIKQREIMQDAYKASKKIPSKGGKKFPPLGGKKFPPELEINKPCKNNIFISNNKERNNPQPPCKGADKAVYPEQQFKLYGKEQNIPLTEQQHKALEEEFGATLISSLIEQLSAYIKSGVKRFRKNTEFYSVLRDWALRRKQKEPNAESFTPPTIDDVKSFCRENNLTIDAKCFYNYYAARGWLLNNGKPAADWQALARCWQARQVDKPQEANENKIISAENDWVKILEGLNIE